MVVCCLLGTPAAQTKLRVLYPRGALAVKEATEEELTFAATKIQKRARIKSDQARVEKMRAEGTLPGQQRAKMIQEWGAAVFKKFDANSDGKLSKKELADALKTLPKTKPKKVLPGTKYQSIDEMIAAMDEDADGTIDEDEWLLNLRDCPGLAAALAENVEAGGAKVTAEEVEAVGAMMSADPEMNAAALKIQARQRGARDRAAVAKAKVDGTLPGQQRNAEAESAVPAEGAA